MSARRVRSWVWLENVRVGADALRIHPLRTLLSVLGVLIGSAALIATMAVSDGMMSFARDQVLRHTSILVVTISPRTSVYRDGEWLPTHDFPVFTTADAAAVDRQVENIDATVQFLAESVAIALAGARGRETVANRGARARGTRRTEPRSSLRPTPPRACARTGTAARCARRSRR